MSVLFNIGKRILERYFDMRSVCVFVFSDRTFEEFIFDCTGRGDRCASARPAPHLCTMPSDASR